MCSRSRSWTLAAAAHAVAVVVVAWVSAASADGGSPAATVDVNVGTFRNTKGWLGCRLYSSPAGFPKEPTARQQRLAITGDVTRCTFTGVPPGTYAVAVMHDENGNDKLDSNFIGIPTEGYGVSNNHTHALSAPTWDESKFEVRAGDDVRLGIVLHY
jgi:uncharacterized protein (DUF2141 family)